MFFMNIRSDSWNNPAFGMNFVDSLNEGTYVTNVIVPVFQAILKNLLLKKPHSLAVPNVKVVPVQIEKLMDDLGDGQMLCL